jgi:hypothetical protein
VRWHGNGLLVEAAPPGAGDDAGSEFRLIPIQRIVPRPDQPRTTKKSPERNTGDRFRVDTNRRFASPRARRPDRGFGSRCKRVISGPLDRASSTPQRSADTTSSRMTARALSLPPR